jgi:hypothetical protein
MIKQLPTIYSTQEKKLKRMVLFFILALIVSGITAIPLEEQLNTVLPYMNKITTIKSWLLKVQIGIISVRKNYPFLFYGYDWLAFAHFLFGILFIGVYKNPVKNKWIIEFGLIACMLIIPFALCFGYIRGIPFWWRLIDCSFGVFGFTTLQYCYTKIKILET